MKLTTLLHQVLTQERVKQHNSRASFTFMMNRGTCGPFECSGTQSVRQSLRGLRLRGIGGQSLNLPWGLTTPYKNTCFNYLFRCLRHGGTRGLTTYTVAL